MEQLSISIDRQNSPDSYQIWIGRDLLSMLSRLISLSKYSKIGVLSDSTVGPLWSKKISQNLPGNVSNFEVAPGEKHKNIRVVEDIWNKMLAAGFDRKSLLINLGGGVIGDMGGFAASTYMRGIDFLQVPTTLLSQVDASVGGKVGIDFSGVKNLIGSFNQPIGVLVDLDTLTTLSSRELQSGLAEIIKHGLIVDRAYFEQVAKLKDLHAEHSELQNIVKRSCEIKSEVVSRDEKESGLRKILNFGHTFGHAIESVALETKAPLLHGEAISIGMLAEAKLSELLGYISAKDISLIEEALTTAKLPLRFPFPASKEKILDLIKSDKKNSADIIRWTLLKSIGTAVFDIEAPADKISAALDFVLNS